MLHVSVFSGEFLGNPSIVNIFIMWFLPLLVIGMNIPVFIVTPRLKDSLEAIKITMISLAITDISLGVQSIIRLCYFTITGNYFFMHDYLCSIDGILYAVFCGVSITTIMYLCIDRVITMKFPLHYKMYLTRKVVICINIGIWCYVTLLFILGHLLLGIELTLLKGPRFCAFEPKSESSLTLIVFFCGFILPACTILTCAAILLHVVYKRTQKLRALTGASAMSAMENLASQKQAIKTIFCMVAGFYICWCPILILVTWSYSYGYTYSTTIDAIANWMSFSNSIWNSLVYLPTMNEYRKIFKNIFIPKMFSSET